MGDLIDLDGDLEPQEREEAGSASPEGAGLPQGLEGDLEPEEVSGAPAAADKGTPEEKASAPGEEPPEWFVKMVEEEGEEAAQAYAEFLIQRSGSPPEKSETEEGESKGEAGKSGPSKSAESPSAVEGDNEEWAFHQAQIHAESEYREAEARSNTLIEQYRKAEDKLKVVGEKIVRLEELGDTGGDDTPYKELVNYRTDLAAEMKRVAETWKPLDQRLSELATEIHVARLVARDGEIVPEIAANKRIYADLIKGGKVQRGTTKAQIVDMINAERVRRGMKPAQAPTDKEKSRERWKRVSERLRAPAKVGGSKNGQGASEAGGAASGRTVTVTGKGHASEPPKDYSAFAPTVAAMLRRADARMASRAKGGR